MKFIRALSCAALAASILLAVSCASVPQPRPEDISPMAVISFDMNETMRFYNYGSGLDDIADAAVSNVVPPKKGLKGKAQNMIAGKLAGAVGEKADRSLRPYLYTDAFVERFNVEQVVLEGLAGFPEFQSMLSAEEITGTKKYASIKSDTKGNVGGFKSLSDEKKLASAQKAVQKAHGARGFASVYVWFGYYMDEHETSLEKALNVIDRIGGGKPSKSQNGYLFPAVQVTVRISDKDGTGTVPAKHYYYNGEMLAKNKKDKVDYKDKRGKYVGLAVGPECIPLEYGNYDAEKLYTMYTEDLVRGAIKNAALRH